jgi:hypothetical protein
MNQAGEVDTIPAAAWRSIVLAAISVTLIGCKDVVRDVAHCKIKAMKAYKPASVDVDERAGQYVLNCMQAAGYQFTSRCTKAGTARYTYPICYE